MRRSVNIYDYPEQLNPFYEETNHNRIRFWGTGKKKRSNSFSFQSIKDFKNALTLRRKKNDKKPINDEDSFMRASADRLSQYSTSRQTIQSFSDDGSFQEPVNPLPLPRFEERVENLRSKRPEIKLDPATSPKRTPIPPISYNPFDNDVDQPLPTERPQTMPRKKKKRPPPPPQEATPAVPAVEVSVKLDSEPTCDQKADQTDAKDEQKECDDISKKQTTPEGETSLETAENGVCITAESTHERQNSEIKCTSESEVMVEPVPSGAAPKAVLEEDSSPEGYEKLDNETHLTDVTIKVTQDDEKLSLSEKSDDSDSLSDSCADTSELLDTSDRPLSSSEVSLYNEGDQHFLEENADLLEMVHKLHMEIDKLTDDTNNNLINEDNFPKGLDARTNNYGAGPTSSKFMRLKKDDEWIAS